MTDAEHEAEKRALREQLAALEEHAACVAAGEAEVREDAQRIEAELREQLAEALAANDRLTASFMKRCEINDDIRARLATVTRERDEARRVAFKEAIALGDDEARALRLAAKTSPPDVAALLEEQARGAAYATNRIRANLT